jgi:nucleotide-binding universal stress UspA family protein
MSAPFPKHLTPSVLIAVDGSRASLDAVDYTVHMAGLIRGLEVVLLHILPAPPPFLVDAAVTDTTAYKRLREIEKENERQGRAVMEKAAQRLKSLGFPEPRVDQRLRRRRTGLVRDIVAEVELGHFDALVVGRRGLSRAEELFMGSVSNQLVHHTMSVPLWIVDGPPSPRPRILAAVDGSEASLRAVDHIAFMLGSNPDVEVDFLHVIPRFQSHCLMEPVNGSGPWDEADAEQPTAGKPLGRGECLTGFSHRAAAILKAGGFSRERVHFFQEEVTLGVARTILRKVTQGGYGTLVLGRRGMERSPLLGGVADRVIRRAGETAVCVWLVN